jgi:hypothetical protein
MYAAFPTHTVFAPIGIVQNYTHTDTQTAATNAKLNLLGFYKAQNNILLSLKELILDFSPADAKAVIDTLQVNQNTLQIAVQRINATPVPNELHEKRTLKEMQKVANNLIDFINDLHFIANRGVIDENSTDYQNFLVEFAHNAQQKDGAVWGKKALFELFE